jgi:hypothetical protein
MEALLAIITMVQRTVGKRLLLKLFARLILLFGLVMMVAFMLSATCIAALLALHSIMIQSGVSALLASCLALAMACAIIALLVAVILWQFKRLNRPNTSSPLMRVLDEFTAGLMAG